MSDNKGTFDKAQLKRPKSFNFEHLEGKKKEDKENQSHGFGMTFAILLGFSVGMAVVGFVSGILWLGILGIVMLFGVMYVNFFSSIL